jgi:hypothetical protein
MEEVLYDAGKLMQVTEIDDARGTVTVQHNAGK